MKGRSWAGAVLAGCLIVLLGCGAAADQLSLSRLAPQQPSTSLVRPIPPVHNNPRDVTAFARRTCELLTPHQAQEFGLDLPPQPLDGLFGTLRCEWRTTTRDRRILQWVDISVFTNNPTLEVAYNQRANSPFFELTEIRGYPAIATRTNADLPLCDIALKPAERQSVTVSYRSEEFDHDPQQACVVGKQVAEAVLLNLPPMG